jgi:hypothetical protein
MFHTVQCYYLVQSKEDNVSHCPMLLFSTIQGVKHILPWNVLNSNIGRCETYPS